MKKWYVVYVVVFVYFALNTLLLKILYSYFNDANIMIYGTQQNNIS